MSLNKPRVFLGFLAISSVKYAQTNKEINKIKKEKFDQLQLICLLSAIKHPTRI